MSSRLCARKKRSPKTRAARAAGASCGWRGHFEFSEVGVLASVVGPLAEADVSVFAVSTYDTDYVLVKAKQLEAAVSALRARGHEIL